MESIKKVVGINLLILLVYMVLINVTSTGQERELGVMLGASIAIGFHVVINLLLAVVFFFQKDKIAKSYLLSAVVVLVIGFSSCLGSVAV